MLRWPRTERGSPSAMGCGFEFQLRQVLPRLQAFFIQLQNCLHQNAGAVRHIRRCCKFFWRMADSTHAWNEDHSDWNDSRKILSIVPCAAWHQLRCQTQTCRCFLNELTKPLICRRWNRSYIERRDRKSTRLNSSHSQISYAVFCLKKKKTSDTQFKSCKYLCWNSSEC